MRTPTNPCASRRKSWSRGEPRPTPQLQNPTERKTTPDRGQQESRRRDAKGRVNSLKRTVKISYKDQRGDQQEATGEQTEQVEQMSQRDASEKQEMVLNARERQGCCVDQEEER